ncbi:exodeoxyribonuclease 7 small subunit [Paenibacillus sp. J31TS4]|uniref:exodeoxyribonuclease VII small subunit n=1 Tax=Paenibacillus sp. J31TS4 TaxID=2807195 RepID=UPI001B128195|nr:exodeoxyribonuclease VII small subunit [Paenibacillus sp. J31TS4]GIP37601.1 exodeoxyribonuclease 7 small subunit [Paenibacillus sp. J31TS4]
MTTDKPELSFEEAMDKLEEIVGRLETGDVPLEQAIELFQQGMELSQLCTLKLDQVERRIEMLIDENGSLSRKPFLQQLEEGEQG